MKYQFTLRGFSAIVIATSSWSAAASVPAGQYRIDSEAVTRSGSGAIATELVQRTDGATGAVTVIQKAGGSTAQQTYKGDGPVTWCVPAPGTVRPPAAAMAAACSTKTIASTATSLKHSAECKNAKFAEDWKRIDDRTWERSLKAEVATGAGVSPRPAVELAMAGMSPAERAQAQAEMAKMPSADAMQAEMAPVIAQLEQQARSGKADEAAMAKQQLAALRSAGIGGPATATQVTTVRERWTRIADTCKPAR